MRRCMGKKIDEWAGEVADSIGPVEIARLEKRRCRAAATKDSSTNLCMDDEEEGLRVPIR